MCLVSIRLLDILERAQPVPEAHFVQRTPYGLDQFTNGGQPRRPFYAVIDLELARHPRTILANDFDDEPLPVPHGAPLRLRVESAVGYKLVKYLRFTEYQVIGDGHGGSREDPMFSGRGAEI